MRYKFITPLFFLLILGLHNSVQCSPNLQTGKEETRHFSFPREYPIGALRMMSKIGQGGENKGSGIGPAQGNLSIKVPAGQSVVLNLNPHCLEHPERLKEIPTAGIDRLIIAYISMDEESHICDAALKALPEFHELISLNVERSDTTDRGLSDFKSLPHVKYFVGFLAGLDGAILAEPQKLKNLETLDLMGNPIKGKYLKFLNALPRLEDLCLNETNVSDDDLKNFPGCPHLKKLHLQGNHRITDKSLPILKLQTNLEVLNIRETGISFAGILKLKNAKLKDLGLTIRRYQPDEIEELKKAFPNAELNYRGRGLASDKAIMYAPLK